MIKVWDLKQGSVLATVAGGKGKFSVKTISTEVYTNTCQLKEG